MHTILILDDDPAILGKLSERLSRLAVKVLTCEEIEAAECLMNLYHPDVLITDLEVSEVGGIEGVKLIRHAATHYPETESVVLSGNITEPVKTLAIKLGARHVLNKGDGLKRVVDLVHKLLGQEKPSSSPTSIPAGESYHVPSLDVTLQKRQIRARLQPIFSLQSSGNSLPAIGVECLSRGPAASLLENPELLFAYASRKEKLFELDMICIEAGLKESKLLPAVGTLFLNVQPRSLTREFFDRDLLRALEVSGYRPEDIVLELTEQHTILNIDRFLSGLISMRSQGLRIALDDYGTGFANLHLVQQLRPEYLKISGHFCHHIHEEETKQIVVESTVEMAKKLGASVVMEHVETAEELAKLQALGVPFGQGYFLARPLTAAELISKGYPFQTIS